MRTESPEQLGRRLREIADDATAGPSVRSGVEHLRELFGRRRSAGVDLAVRALDGAIPEASVRALSTAFVTALGDAYDAT
ncbi:hypothetical protein ACN27G_36410 [Plantactinospora sp. WMMB334]|uniref:hypothetical protein n=1 Tax=Plantactinospora sp. WMMB334 TaxID=3404119 RepID=UPI003B95A3E6